MEVKEQANLRFFGVDIINVKYNAMKFNEGKEPIIVDTESGIYYPKEAPNEFKILLKIKLTLKDVFDLEVSGVGNFALSEVVKQEDRPKYINANAVAIMFPFMRSFISTFSLNCGNILGNIIIPVQFFQGELKEITAEEIQPIEGKQEMIFEDKN
jgi:preprotein translocase subunit SecB